MPHTNPYLTFNGNCREAMTFYQQCLGGELVFQTLGDTPMGDKMPQNMQNCILHSSLTNGNLMIMGTDMVSLKGLIKGNAVTIMLNFDSELDIKMAFHKLTVGGTIDSPLEETFLGALLGSLIDKYGNSWLFSFNQILNH